MTKIETLVDTLGAADPNERAKALAELVGAGRPRFACRRPKRWPR
jgi:hypothetical protein